MRAKTLLLAASALLACGSLRAASLKLSDGATLRILSIAQPVGAGHQAAGEERSLRFTVTEPDGRTWAGAVPGSEGVSPLDVSLAQNPRSGDVVMAFARQGAASRDIVASTWSGQAWSEPVEISSAPSDESSPILAFRPTGDALIAWTSRTSFGETVLLRHAELGADVQTYSFVDVGAPTRLAGDAGLTSGAEPKLLGLTAGTESMAAYLLMGAEDGTPMSVVRLGLDAILDGGGFGAAPVPVSFIRSSTQSAPSAGGINGRAGDSAVGEILAPWRMVFGSGEAWYWLEASRVSLVPRIDGVAGRVINFDAPATEALLHVEAYRVARAELGFVARRGGTGDLPVGARRLR